MFPISMTITVSTQQELDMLVSVITADKVTTSNKVEGQSITESKKTVSEKLAGAKDEATKAANKAVQEGKAEGETPVYTLDKAKALTISAVKTLGRDKTAAILAQFGAAKAGELAPENVEPCCIALEEALKS